MVETLPALAYDAFDAPPLHAVRFLVQASPRPAARTLDIGCGTGRVMAALVDRGWPIVGLEPDELLRERAYARLAGRAAIVDGRLETLDVGDGWELISVVNGPLAYVLRRDDRREALARIHKALAAGGVLVLDLPNFPWILDHYRAPGVAIRSLEGWTFTRTPVHEIDRVARTFTHRDRFVAERGAERVVFDRSYAMAMFAWWELAEDLADVGFADHRTHPSLADIAPGPVDGPRMVVVARR